MQNQQSVQKNTALSIKSYKIKQLSIRALIYHQIGRAKFSSTGFNADVTSIQHNTVFPARPDHHKG